MIPYHVLAPYPTVITSDTVNNAVKNYVRMNRHRNITNMIITDQQNHWDARMKYFRRDGRNRVGINVYPRQTIPLVKIGDQPNIQLHQPNNIIMKDSFGQQTIVPTTAIPQNKMMTTLPGFPMRNVLAMPTLNTLANANYKIVTPTSDDKADKKDTVSVYAPAMQMMTIPFGSPIPTIAQIERVD